MRTIIDYFLLALKGFGMGSADVVPGVSGGTIAFITGIYEELIDSIKGVNLGLLKTLRKEGLKAAWTQLNGNFLVAVFGGIMASVLSLAKLLSYLLEAYPVQLWSFFLGLILASTFIVGRQVGKWDMGAIFAFLIGGGIALFISLSTSVQTPQETWFFFVAGAIAICAMILPGISGSFILVILGQYGPILEAAHERNFKVLLVFMAGCVVGLLSFARLVSYLFKNFRNQTIAVLTGFMIGSLPKVWPWKIATPEELKRGLGELVLPGDYASQTGEPSHLVVGIVLALLAMIVVLSLEQLASRQRRNQV